MANKRFIFNWHRNEKYSNPITRENMVEAETPSAATGVFMRTFGNLKLNTINFIQEIDKEGNPVGEQIKPD